jgi:hypothetical protein
MVASEIDEPGHPTGPLRRSHEQEKTMLKTISAALLAASFIAAPALAAGSGKTTENKTTQAPVAKTEQAKPGTLKANAKMSSHHVKHHRHHNKMGAIKSHSKLGSKQVTSAVKRG